MFVCGCWRAGVDRTQRLFRRCGVLAGGGAAVARAAVGRAGAMHGREWWNNWWATCGGWFPACSWELPSAAWRSARWGKPAWRNFFQQIWPAIPGAHAALIAHALALTLAFALLSSLHVVVGELVPKTLSLARAERVALLIALPFHWFLQTFRWAIYLLDRVANGIIKGLGVTAPASHGVAHSTEELQIQIQQARERGLLAAGEEKFIVSAIELTQVQVREIMVPRPDMHTLPVESTLDQVMRAFATTQRSGIPVYRGSQDHILGFVHIKDMLWVLLDRERRAAENLPPPAFDLRRVLREVLIVPETKPASELLPELRARHVGLAMVVDEFGSILGLVTLEDILEQVVGRNS